VSYPTVEEELNLHVTSACIKAANRVVQELVAQHLAPYKTALIAGGGLTFLFKDGHFRADIECYNDGKMLYALTGHYVQPQIEEVTDLSAAITAIARYMDPRTRAASIELANAVGVYLESKSMHVCEEHHPNQPMSGCNTGRLRMALEQFYEGGEPMIDDHTCGEDCGHKSDCALHNAPALPVGPCSCGAE
jgi:hypothetical protein